jgi:hypothetical protein
MELTPENKARLDRRVEMLLLELKSADPDHDRAVNMLLRVISNYCSVGRNGDSLKIKLACCRMSRGAMELRRNSSLKNWHAATQNEHQKPLRDVWMELVDMKDDITHDIIIKKFSEWPMVTVLNAEHGLLENVGKGKSPAERYAAIAVEERPQEGWPPFQG